MADAIITAEMRMNNQQFLDATKNSAASMKMLKSQSSDLNANIGGLNQVSQGLSQIMTGQLAPGLAAVSGGLNAMAPKVMALLGPLGLIAAAFGAAYVAGKKLDELTGISDKFGKMFGGDTSATDEMAKNTAAMRERRQGLEQAQKLADENAKMTEARMKGVAKLDADYARESSGLQKKINATKNDDVRNALQSRLTMISTFHAQDVAATRQAEAEKLRAVKEAEAAKVRAAKEASENRTKQISLENENMRISTMTAVQKIDAEFERDIRAVTDQIEQPGTTQEQRDLLAERKQLISDKRQRDLDAIDRQDVIAPRQSLIPARMDQMQSVGGYLGGERINLPVQNKAEEMQRENNQAIRNNINALSELTAEVRQLSSSMTGGIN